MYHDSCHSGNVCQYYKSSASNVAKSFSCDVQLAEPFVVQAPWSLRSSEAESRAPAKRAVLQSQLLPNSDVVLDVMLQRAFSKVLYAKLNRLGSFDV